MSKITKTGKVIMTSLLIASIGLGGISGTVTSLFDSVPANEIAQQVEIEPNNDKNLFVQAAELVTQVVSSPIELASKAFSVPSAEASSAISPQLQRQVDNLLNNFYKKIANRTVTQQVEVLQVIVERVDNLLKTRNLAPRSAALIQYMGDSVQIKINSLQGNTNTNVTTPNNQQNTQVWNQNNQNTVVNQNTQNNSNEFQRLQNEFLALGGQMISLQDRIDGKMTDEIREANGAAIKQMYEKGLFDYRGTLSDSQIPLSIMTGASRQELQQATLQLIQNGNATKSMAYSPFLFRFERDRLPDGHSLKYMNTNIGMNNPGLTSHHSEVKYGYSYNGRIDRGTPLYEELKNELVNSLINEGGVAISHRNRGVIKLEPLPLGDNLLRKIEAWESLTLEETYQAWTTAIELEGLGKHLKVTKAERDGELVAVSVQFHTLNSRIPSYNQIVSVYNWVAWVPDSTRLSSSSYISNVQIRDFFFNR